MEQTRDIVIIDRVIVAFAICIWLYVIWMGI